MPDPWTLEPPLCSLEGSTLQERPCRRPHVASNKLSRAGQLRTGFCRDSYSLHTPAGTGARARCSERSWAREQTRTEMLPPLCQLCWCENKLRLKVSQKKLKGQQRSCRTSCSSRPLLFGRYHQCDPRGSCRIQPNWVHHGWNLVLLALVGLVWHPGLT